MADSRDEGGYIAPSDPSQPGSIGKNFLFFFHRGGNLEKTGIIVIKYFIIISYSNIVIYRNFSIFAKRFQELISFIIYIF